MFKPRIKREFWVAVAASSEADAKRQARRALKGLGYRPPRTGNTLTPYYDAIFALGHRAPKDRPESLAPYEVFDYREYEQADRDAQTSDSPNYMVRIAPIY